MSVSVANGVSATTAQFAEYRGTTAPTVGQIGDLWQNTSTSPPTLYQCVSISPVTYAAVSTGGGGGTATNLAGGDVNTVVYQSSTNNTAFVTAPVTEGSFLQWGSETGLQWSNYDPNSAFIHTILSDGILSYNHTTNTTVARTLSAGTGISLTNADGLSGDPVITNSAPDQTVVLTAGTGISITGTYPSFTINATGGGGGVSSFNTRTGAVTLSSADVTTALGFTPYNATNPAGYTSNVGTVTSVGGTGTVSGLTLTGSVTVFGNLTLGGTLSVTPSNFASQTANTFLAAPNGAAGVPTFRAVVAADIPTLNQNTTGTASNVTGTVAIGNGGTGLTTTPTNGQIDIGNGTGFTRTTISAGIGISVTNGAGSISVANTAPDQTVVLTAGSGISVSGTYPSFTITNTGGGGGGSSFTRGTATLDFGAYPGSNEASVAVTGQTAILTTSNIQAFIMGDSTSTTYTADDHKYLATLLDLSTNTATASTGFTIYARSIHKIKGTVTVNWTWV